MITIRILKILTLRVGKGTVTERGEPNLNRGKTVLGGKVSTGNQLQLAAPMKDRRPRSNVLMRRLCEQTLSHARRTCREAGAKACLPIIRCRR